MIILIWVGSFWEKIMCTPSTFICFGDSWRMFALVTEALYYLEIWAQKTFSVILSSHLASLFLASILQMGCRVYSPQYYCFSKKLIFLKYKHLHPSFVIKCSTESFEVLVLLVLSGERKRGRGTWIKYLIFSIWKCSFLYHCISQKLLIFFFYFTLVPIKKNSFWNLLTYTEQNCHPLNHS